MFFIRCFSNIPPLFNARWLILLVLLQSPLCFAISSDELDEEYQRLVRAALTALEKNTSKEQKHNDYESLLRAVTAAQSSGSKMALVELITANKALLADNIDKQSTLAIFRHLLEQQVLPLADTIFQLATRYADTYTLSRFNYQYALFYYHQGYHEQAQKYLASIEVRNALSEAEGDYATLLFGIILQYQKQHRAAVKHYQTIAPESPYYNHAQLNTAVAYIRQGWWTDAQIAIDKGIHNKAAPADEELLNRLYLVLGYNQLQHEFYRDARESFRSITVDSFYADRALLGIGLCALNQGDFVGAINAFNILKSKSATNISVTEAHLLYAYAHEQLGERALASAQYEAAIAYFNQRLLQLGKNDNANAYFTENDQESRTIAKRRDLLDWLTAKIHSKTLISRLDKLNNDYSMLSRQIDTQQQQKSFEILTSYLSQAQFGQAKLFDTLQ